MKTHFKLVVAAIALMPTLIFGQAAFDKFEQDANFTTVSVNKKAFAMLSQIKAEGSEKEIQEAKMLASKIESFKVVVTEKSESIGSLKTATEKYIKSAGLDELMKVKEKDADFRIMVKTAANETQLSEVLVFVQGNDKKAMAVTVIVKGLFDLDELEQLTDKVLPKATDAKIDAKLVDVKDALVLKVSPNPASGVFYINATTPAEVKLYDASGRVVKSQKYSSEGVSTTGITPGTYVVEITTDGRRQTERIIIK